MRGAFNGLDFYEATTEHKFQDKINCVTPLEFLLSALYFQIVNSDKFQTGPFWEETKLVVFNV